MVIAELDEVQYDLEVDGELVRRQLGRQIWEARGWATVAIAFTERASDGSWKAPKLALLRFRRMNEAWKKQASLTIGGGAALALGETIESWRSLLGGDGGDDDD